MPTPTNDNQLTEEYADYFQENRDKIILKTN